MSRLTGRIQRGEVRLRGGSITGYLSDHPANLTQLELLSESEDFLVAMGFVPILELDSVTASATLPEEPRSENEVRAEVHLGHVQCHLRADTVRCLRSLQSELSALLPVAIPVSMPEVVTQQPMPEGFDLGEDSLLTPECERLDDTDDHNILAGVDMFAFAPLDRVAPETEASGSLAEALSSAMGEPGPGPQLLSPPVPAQELVRNSSDASSSCLVDEYIRAQELQQSPRSPVTACPWSPEEGPFEMELLELPEADETEEMEEREVEPHEESSSQEAHEAVAVCLFDPEALPEQRILELCDEEPSRQEVEKQFHVEEPPPKSTTAGQVRYQEGSSVIFFQDPAGVQIVEDHFVPGSHPKHNQKFEPPPWAPPPKTVLMLRVDRLSLSAHQGSDFGGRPRDKESIASERRRTHLSVQVKEAAAKLMMFPARRSRPVARRRLVETSTLRWRLVLCARDFDILDRVHGSVFSHVLSYFEDEEKRPRPSMVDMLLLRVDELVHHALDAESEPPFPELAPEYYVDLQLLPLQLTVDQDTVDFLADFIQLCCLQDYVEELGDGQEDFLAAAGIAPDVTEEGHRR
ncbi:unnamed protein product [Effrenium voratum]|nr:unnamed protein product [Effrenium voratum]